VDFLLVIIELFSLGVTVEALRANIDASTSVLDVPPTRHVTVIECSAVKKSSSLVAERPRCMVGQLWVGGG